MPTLRQIEFADELGSERRAAGGVECVQYVEMFLHQLRTRERAEIKHGIIDSVDSVGADRNNDIAMTREHFGNVVITLITRNRQASIVQGHCKN